MDSKASARANKLSAILKLSVMSATFSNVRDLDIECQVSVFLFKLLWLWLSFSYRNFHKLNHRCKESINQCNCTLYKESIENRWFNPDEFSSSLASRDSIQNTKLSFPRGRSCAFILDSCSTAKSVKQVEYLLNASSANEDFTKLIRLTHVTSEQR